MHWQNKHSWLIPATGSTHTSIQTRQGSSGLRNTPYTVTFWQVLFIRSSALASPFNQQCICQGLGAKLRCTHGRNSRSFSMFPSPIFANLWNYRRKRGSPDTPPSWRGWIPSGSSAGSAEALLMLVILSRHDPARRAAEGSRGAPLPEGPGGSRALPSRSSRPRAVPSRSSRPAPRLRSAHGAIRVPARPWRRWRSSKQVGPGLGHGMSRAAGRAGARIGLPRPPGWVSELPRALMEAPVPWRCPRPLALPPSCTVGCVSVCFSIKRILVQ